MAPMRFLTMTHFDWLMVTVFVFVLVIMQWRKKLPSIDSWHAAFDAINSRGGNIVILALMTMSFFRSAMQAYYWTMDKMVDGKISVDNALMLAGWTFITGSAFGGASSALYKSMNADSTPAPKPVPTATLPDKPEAPKP